MRIQAPTMMISQPTRRSRRQAGLAPNVIPFATESQLDKPLRELVHEGKRFMYHSVYSEYRDFVLESRRREDQQRMESRNNLHERDATTLQDEEKELEYGRQIIQSGVLSVQTWMQISERVAAQMKELDRRRKQERRAAREEARRRREERQRVERESE